MSHHKLHPFKLGVSTLFVLTSTLPVSAAFINGVESFSGSSLDTTTWTAHFNGFGGSFSQNNELNVVADVGGRPQSYDYKAPNTPIAVGAFVQTDVTFHSHNLDPIWTQTAGLVLTSNSKGGAFGYLADTAFVGLLADFNVSTFTGVHGGNGGGSGFNLPSLLHPGQTVTPLLETQYTLRIDRLTQTSFRDTLYDGTGIKLCALDFAIPTAPTAMYVDLAGVGTSSTYHIVVIPEPSSLSIFALGLIGAIRRRNIHKRKTQRQENPQMRQ
jgi:hypothetical protein